MASVRLHDTLRLQKDSSLAESRLQVRGNDALGVPEDRSNLVLKALDSLQQAAGVPDGIRAELVKRIPSQAGLGGGSSDAAAALVGGARLWGLDWPIERLARLAARLGSDIPFFVYRLVDPRNRFALATGRGERIEPVLAAAGLPVVIVKPEVGLSTAAVYAACGSISSIHTHTANPDYSSETIRALRSGRWQDLRLGLRNDLQAAAETIAPWLSRLRRAFEASGCTAHQLSGSGSAYFGLTGSLREATRVAARLRAMRLGRVFVTTVG